MPEQDDSLQDVFVARQPILDEQQEVFAYELLYRSSWVNSFPTVDSNVATSRIITSAMLTFGLDRLADGRPAFINFDREMLVNGYAAMLPNASVVVELLEDIEPDEEVLRTCRKLKEKGYMLALDDCVSLDIEDRLLDLVDIVKVDFQQASEAVQAGASRAFHRSGIRLLAEKVETSEDFRRARGMGYDLFQGYFFSKPSIVEGREIPGFKLNYLKVLQEISQPELNFDKVGEIVKHEPSLVHKLLRYVNSASLNVRTEIRSIRHALTLLGELETRKWFSLVALTGLASDKPLQLMINAVVRGRTCELLSKRLGLGDRSSEMFLMGMFSLVDAALDQPMERVLEGVYLADDVHQTLVDGPDRPDHMKAILDLAVAYEEADWRTMHDSATALPLPFDTLPDIYVESVGWGEAVFRD